MIASLNKNFSSVVTVMTKLYLNLIWFLPFPFFSWVTPASSQDTGTQERLMLRSNPDSPDCRWSSAPNPTRDRSLYRFIVCTYNATFFVLLHENQGTFLIIMPVRLNAKFQGIQSIYSRRGGQFCNCSIFSLHSATSLPILKRERDKFFFQKDSESS